MCQILGPLYCHFQKLQWNLFVFQCTTKNEINRDDLHEIYYNWFTFG